MTESTLHLSLVLGLAFAMLGCGPHEAKDAPSPSPKGSAPKPAAPEEPAAEDADPFGDIESVTCPLPDFDRLDPASRRTVYLLGRAAQTDATVRAARSDIAASRARALLSSILAAKSRVPKQVFDKIESYALRFRLSDGTQDAWTGERIRPRFIPGELAAAAQAVLDSGIDIGLDEFNHADLGANRLEQLDQYLAALRPVLFGAPPKTSGDIDVQKEPDTDGKTAATSKAAAEAVRRLLPFLDEGERVPLRELAAFFETGNPDRYFTYLAASEKKAFARELVATFDGRGAPSADGLTGRFLMIAATTDPDRTPLVEKVAKKVDYFERNLPGNAMFKRPLKTLLPPAAAAYFVIEAPPYADALEAGAYTLPLPRRLADGRHYKAMLFSNTVSNKERRFAERRAAAFSPDEPTKFLRVKWREAALSAFSILKNVIGYQAGTRKGAAADADPLKTTVTPLLSVLEEVHADLVALYFSFDAESHALGLIPETECARAVLVEYTARFLEHAEVPGDMASPRGRRILAERVVTRGLLRSDAISVDPLNGHFQVVVRDEEAALKSLEAQLAEAQRILSLGDLGAAQTLVDTDGGPLPKIWREDVEKRLDEIGVRPKTAYLFPVLTAEKNKQGEIVNVTADVSVSLSERLTGRLGEFIE